MQQLKKLIHENLINRITIDSTICHGKPCVRDLRYHIEKNFALCDENSYIHFISTSKSSDVILLPFKKQKRTDISLVKKQLNQAMSKIRVRVEHAFAGLKRLKIMSQKIRIPSYEKRQVILRIAAAIHNFRVKARNPLVFNL